MKKLWFVFLAIFLVCLASAREKANSKLYVGTFTSEGAEGIYLCNFDYSTGEISLEKTFKGIDNPSFLKISPDRKKLYAVTRPPAVIENSGRYVNAYQIKPNGDLEFINKQISNGADPCHVDVSPDGKFVAVANYGGGSTSLYKVTSNGGLNPANSVIVNEGSGPTTRQTAPHAHSIRFSQDGKQVFSADLGTDKLNIYDLKKEKLVPAKQPFVTLAPGTGPRHFDFHPHATIIYVINELNSTITSFSKNGNKWNELETVSTLPEDFSGTNYCADIHVSPDGKYLYGSNRGHNSIAIFKTNSVTKKPEMITTVSTRGDWPRNFTLSPDGKFLLVANQRSGNIVVFKINTETGIPEFTGKELKIPAPVCLEFL